MEERIKNFGNAIIRYSSTIVAIGIAIWWIFYGTIKIYPSSLNITDRIGLTICTIVLALSYCKLISQGGFQSAKNSEEYKRISKDYSEAIKASAGRREQVMDYCRRKCIANLREVREENLANVGITYNEIFDENGRVRDIKLKQYTRQQRKIIKKCAKLQIEIPEVFGRLSNKFFGIKREKTQKEFEAKQDILHAIIRSVMSIVSVGLMFEFLGFNASAIIYAIFQIVMWSASGITQRVKNYNFIINITLPYMVEKTLIINECLGGQPNGE